MHLSDNFSLTIPTTRHCRSTPKKRKSGKGKNDRKTEEDQEDKKAKTGRKGRDGRDIARRPDVAYLFRLQRHNLRSLTHHPSTVIHYHQQALPCRTPDRLSMSNQLTVKSFHFDDENLETSLSLEKKLCRTNLICIVISFPS